MEKGELFTPHAKDRCALTSCCLGRMFKEALETCPSSFIDQTHT